MNARVAWTCGLALLCAAGGRAQDPAGDEAPADIGVFREAACRALLLAKDARAAAACYRALADDVTQPGDVRARAGATVALVDAWAEGAPAQLEPTLTTSAHKETLSVSALISQSVKEGLAEGVLASAVLGAVGVTTATSALLATTRTDKIASTPILMLAPALGGIAGAAAGYGVIHALEPSPGDVALATSASTLGFIAAFPLQMVLFKDSTAVSDVPLRFVTILAGGAAGALAGGAASSFFDVTQGDVALAHSASLWSTVFMSFVLSYQGGDGMKQVPAFEAALLVPYVVVIAAHEHVEINRFATWLIEAGGVSGLIAAGAAAIVTSPTDARPYFMAGTVAGVGAGLVAAWVADDFLDLADDGGAP